MMRKAFHRGANTGRRAMGTLPDKVTIVEMGPRDGLQNEKVVPTDIKVDFINKLSQSGLSKIETTSYVNPKLVPTMADNSKVMNSIVRSPGVQYPVLTPNLKGYLQAKEDKASEVAIFASASETFSKRNINCTIKESIERFVPIMEEAKKDGIKVRGYISCIVGCPFEGFVPPEQTALISKELYDLGCFEISLGAFAIALLCSLSYTHSQFFVKNTHKLEFVQGTLLAWAQSTRCKTCFGKSPSSSPWSTWRRTTTIRMVKPSPTSTCRFWKASRSSTPPWQAWEGATSPRWPQATSRRKTFCTCYTVSGLRRAWTWRNSSRRATSFQTTSADATTRKVALALKNKLKNKL